jgi:hypothetical protein
LREDLRRAVDSQWAMNYALGSMFRGNHHAHRLGRQKAGRV